MLKKGAIKEFFILTFSAALVAVAIYFFMLPSHAAIGSISAITKIKKDKYSVNIGQFTMDFTKKELIKAQKPQEKKKKETRLSGYNPASHAALSLDLRGKRSEEVNYLMFF